MAADPAGTYAAAADVVEAFAADGVLDATFMLPELGPGAAFPGALAIGFHFVDYVVHGWDVARTIDAPFQPRADVVAAASYRSVATRCSVVYSRFATALSDILSTAVAGERTRPAANAGRRIPTGSHFGGQ